MKSISERTLIKETSEMAGKEVNLRGWVDSVRDHGKVVFVDLRDRTGIVQCVITDEKDKLGAESVIDVTGLVQARPDEAVNKDLETGTVEIDVKEYEILNTCKEIRPCGLIYLQYKVRGIYSTFRGIRSELRSDASSKIV